MTLVRVFLWWPRNARGLAGVVYPRLRSGSDIFWRTLHAMVGIYFALILVTFLLSALPWTTLWDGKVLEASSMRSISSRPRGSSSSPLAISITRPLPAPLTTTPDRHWRNQCSLDRFMQNARAAGARGNLELHPVVHGGPSTFARMMRVPGMKSGCSSAAPAAKC